MTFVEKSWLDLTRFSTKDRKDHIAFWHKNDGKKNKIGSSYKVENHLIGSDMSWHGLVHQNFHSWG